MSILQIIARVKERCIPGTLDCIPKHTHARAHTHTHTHTHTHKLQYYVYMQMLVTVVMKMIVQVVQIKAFKLEPNKTHIFL